MSGVTWDVCGHVTWHISLNNQRCPQPEDFHKTRIVLSSPPHLTAVLTWAAASLRDSTVNLEGVAPPTRPTCCNFHARLHSSDTLCEVQPGYSHNPLSDGLFMRWWLLIPLWLVAWARRRKRPNVSTPRSRNSCGETREMQEGSSSCCCWVSVKEWTELTSPHPLLPPTISFHPSNVTHCTGTA